MPERVVIIGAGGHGKVAADIVLERQDQVAGFLDDAFRKGDSFLGFPVLGRVEDYQSYRNTRFLIAVGDGKARQRIAGKLSDAAWYTAVHPKAAVSRLEVEIGVGTMVMANAVVNPGSRIGRHCIINTGAVVEHDNVIGDYVHISVGAKLAGTVQVGKGSWIGIGASVNQNLTICGGCMVGAGAVVVKDLCVPGTYAGVPAERMEEMKAGKKKRKTSEFLGGGVKSLRLPAPSDPPKGREAA